MGEIVQEEKKSEEGKTPEAEKKQKEDQKPVEENPKSEEKKSEDANNKDDKESKDAASPPPPPPPPPEIVMRVYMHCEGCARKVRRCLKGFDGVENVITDCKTHKVVVKGEKADPLKVVDRVQKKTHRQVELLSPIPKPPAPEEKKPEEKEAPKPEKKEEPKVVTVVLKVHMHCEACSLEIKKRIERMKEVEEAIPDLKNSQVSVKGTFDPPKLVEYVYKRTSKHATIVKQDPPPEKKGEGGEEGKKGEEKGEEGKGDKKEDGGGGGGDDVKAVVTDGGGAAVSVEDPPMVMEFKRNEYYYYPPRYAMEMHAYPPQIFSDENPNACSLM